MNIGKTRFGLTRPARICRPNAEPVVARIAAAFEQAGPAALAAGAVEATTPDTTAASKASLHGGTLLALSFDF
ncbi:MAG: hypothetical protein ACR2ML_06630 [Solirubrobacteraceae bacterium]